MLAVITLVMFVILFLYWENNGLMATSITYQNKKVPKGFEGYRILQVSDLHNKNFGRNQKRLVDKTRELQPHMIVITGDLIDSDRMEHALNYLKQAVLIAPVYYVSGNHEHNLDAYDRLCSKMSSMGVVLLSDLSEVIVRGEDSFTLLGLDDPSFIEDEFMEANQNYVFEQKLITMMGSSSTEFNLLLSHRPEKAQMYAGCGIQLTLSGHAHGGQVRLPVVGGFFAPNQGILPKYTAGSYSFGEMTMIVSRGVGNSIAPQRIFNRPELVLVTLMRD